MGSAHSVERMCPANSVHEHYATTWTQDNLYRHKSDTHHQTTSSDSHKVPDKCGHMLLLNIYHLSIRKEKQDICHDAASGEGNEGQTQRPGKAQRTHLHTEQRE